MNDKLLIKYLLKETSQEEEKVVKKWVTAHPDHQKQYDHIHWIWENSKNLAQKSDVDENAAWQRFLERKAQKVHPVPKSGSRFLTPIWVRAAAAVALVFLLGWSVFSLLPHSGRAYFSAVLLESDSFSVQESLLDGSLITLNKNSRVNYSQKLFSRQRLVNMVGGEAYFQVQKNQRRPFIVQTENIAITVLGTSFNVKNEGEITIVIVDSGAVKVEMGNQQVFLEPHEKAILNRVKGTLEKSVQEDQLFRYYVNNLFVAENTPLQQIVEALNIAYGSEITIASDELKTLPITTTLEYGSLDDNLEVIKETLGIQISKEDNKIVLQ